MTDKERELFTQALNLITELDKDGLVLEMGLILEMREALAQPEQTPDAWRNAAIRLGEDLYSVGPDGYYDMTAKQWLDWALGVVNTAPPRKPWVGLTDEEIKGILDCGRGGLVDIKKAEQILKEKNGG